MYQTAFNDDPDEEEVKYWSKLLRKHTLRLARKGYEGEEWNRGQWRGQKRSSWLSPCRETHRRARGKHRASGWLGVDGAGY
jgi:hypothetical protein